MFTDPTIIEIEWTRWTDIFVRTENKSIRRHSAEKQWNVIKTRKLGHTATELAETDTRIER